MQQLDAVDISAAERAVVGLCHSLNDQLAAVSAYVFLLKRRGALGDIEDPLQSQLDRLADSIRLVRSLARDAEPEVVPISMALLAETATSIMRTFPDGPVAFQVADDASSAVVRCDWTGALRAILFAGAWVGRDYRERVDARLSVATEGDAPTLNVEALGELPSPLASGPRHDRSRGFHWSSTGERSVTIHLIP